MFVNRSEFSRLRKRKDWSAANEALFREYQKHGIVRCSIDRYFTADPDFYSTPDKWR